MSWLALPFIIRPLIAVLTQGFFQPDEYFQSLEPAHRAVFGYGHLTWEWTAQPPIRSIAYPAIWMPVYSALQRAGLDNGALLVLAPKLLSGLLAALTDFFGWKLARKLYGPRVANVWLLLSLSSIFHVLALSRTFSNSLETSLTVAALYYWPLVDGLDHDLTKALILAALSCLIRPTSAIIWTLLGVELLVRTVTMWQPVAPILSKVAIVGTLFSLAQLGLDTTYYGKPTFTPFNFLSVNISSVSSFYGVNQWHYYFTQALPILCTTSLPFVAHGAWLTKMLPGEIGRGSRTLFNLCRWVVTVYSFMGHKEWRFIHPLLPIFHLFAALSLASLFAKSVKAEAKKDEGKEPSTTIAATTLPIRRAHLILLLSTLPASIYVIFFHSRAQIAVMHHLRSLPSSELRSVGFLMPCHSTPWQAYLHRPEVEMWAIGCEPPLSVDSGFPPSPLPSSPPGDSSVTDWIYAWPSHLAFFGHLTHTHPEIEQILRQKGYQVTWETGNGWEEDERRRGGIQVWSFSQ
ncbi:glycosylphosphatidylinositol anchor biosynthesis [Tulasnella sp. 417]|nr:glycosylphosphatidylinositol anchor biosynthesis [Tulasnella sp. 417]